MVIVMFDIEDNIFMLAGPVKIHPRVLRAMAVPSVSHRSKEFESVNAEIKELLHYLFQSKNEVAVFSGSGTAGVEAAIANLLNTTDKVVVIDNGKFGERLFKICEIYAQPLLLKFEWGKAPDLSAVAEQLEKKDVKALVMVHNETSTGLTNPAEQILKIAYKNDVLTIVDCITSIGGLEVKIDEWHIDAAIIGSQKCLAAPAGLAAVCISEKALDTLHKKHSNKTFYLDLKAHIEKLKARDTPWTPAIPLFLAFREALRILKEEGLEKRLKRTSALGQATRAAVKSIGLEIFPDEKYASDTVSAIKYPLGIDDKNFRNMLKNEFNVVIAGAQDHIKGKVFRIGHMGLCNFNELTATFAAIEACLKKNGYSVKTGAGVGAIIEHMV